MSALPIYLSTLPDITPDDAGQLVRIVVTTLGIDGRIVSTGQVVYLPVNNALLVADGLTQAAHAIMSARRGDNVIDWKAAGTR